MTADTITAIKKALEKVYIGGWYISGVKTNGLSVVHNAADSSMFGITAETFEAEYVVAANPFAISELLSTLESLQRENAELRQDRDRTARNRDMYKGQVERQAVSLSKFREEEIRLRETLFKCGSFIADRYQEGDAEYQVVLLVNDAICSKPALASTGGEHHAE